MKKIFNYIALATLTLSAFACSQEDFTSSYLSDSKAVHISAQIGENAVTSGFQTRSNPLGTQEEQAKFNAGDQISVAAGSQSAVIYTLGDNETWTPETSKYLVWSSDQMEFAAYYPVGKNNASASDFTVPSSYNSVEDLKNADYMTYVAEKNKTMNNSVTLPMERKMVRFVFNSITIKNQYKDYEVSAIKVHSNTKGYKDKSLESGDIVVTAYNYDGKFYALLAPTVKDDEKTFLTITVKDKNNNNTKELTVKGIPSTTAKNSYDVTLTIGKDKASITNITIKDWVTGTLPTNNGETTEKK